MKMQKTLSSFYRKESKAGEVSFLAVTSFTYVYFDLFSYLDRGGNNFGLPLDRIVGLPGLPVQIFAQFEDTSMTFGKTPA